MLSLLYCNAYSQEKSKVVDSLKVILKNTKNDSIIMDTYNKLRRATYYINQEESEQYTHKFLEYAEKLKDSSHIALADFYLGNAYNKKKQYTIALDYYLKSLEYYEVTNDKRRKCSVINAIGYIYEKKEEYVTAIDYYKRSAEIADNLGDNRRAAIGFANTGKIQFELKKYNEASANLSNAIVKIEMLQASDKNWIPKTQEILHIAQISLAECYTELNKIDDASKLFKKVKKDIDSTKEQLIYAQTLLKHGNLYNKQKKYKSALLNYEESYAILKNGAFTEDLYELMPIIIQSYKTNGELDKGFKVFEKYNKLKDSLLNFEKDLALTEVLQKYEAAEKDKLIAEKNFQLLRKNELNKIILISATALILLAILAVLFYKNRLKYQRTIAEQQNELNDKEITQLKQNQRIFSISRIVDIQEKERARIACDLHDGLGGLLSAVKSHTSSILENSKVDEPLRKKTLSLINEAAEETRRISHNMMPHSLTIVGLIASINDIAERLQKEDYKVSLEINTLPKLNQVQEVHLYRLIQEITSNIEKHAKAKSIFLQLVAIDNQIQLTVQDDGVGFNVKSENFEQGLGLKNIEDRVAFLNGDIIWDTAIGEGTEINISFAA